MQKILPKIREHANALLKLLTLLAFAIPCFWLYALYPATFELLWKGRTFQLFFIWLILLELILGWESLQTKMTKPLSARSIAFGVSLFLPAIYVLVSNYFGLNTFIADWAQQSSIQWANLMPLSTEYLVFAVLFCVTLYFCHGISGLKDFSVPIFFMVIVGALYTIDNVFPYGQFTPLQFFVPATTWFAARTLGLMGYNVTPGIQRDTGGSLPLLTVADTNSPVARSATFAIAWPCAGIESFLIFTVVVLLFLKRMPISWKAKTSYFAIGAAVTYFINVLRIVTIFTIGVNYGESSEPVQLFHYFYGPLYSVAWIISYPLIIIVSQSIWHKIQTRNTILNI